MGMETIKAAFALLIFPGLLFLSSYGMFAEWLDRKLYARMQYRIGPPWFQPFADFVKLMGKEVIVPRAADRGLFKILPSFAGAAVCTSILMIPVWGPRSVFSFQGDLVAVIYLLTIPTVTFFLGGWSSTSPFAAIGSLRVLTQLFAYEVPLLMAVLGPAILSGTWSIEGIAAYFTAHPGLLPVNLIGLAISLVALQGKLERVPFDIPHGETEIVGGVFTEYSGRLLAFFLLATDMEMVVGAALISAVFLGGAMGLPGFAGFLLFVLKSVIIIFILSAMRALMARIRIEQMIGFCWKVLAPAALAQTLVNLIVKALL